MIKFGTDGWRAVIAEEYTFENLGRVACGTAQWLKSEFGDGSTVVLGFDTRFQGQVFAQHVARVLAGEGVRVIMSDAFTSTPAISWATLEYGCDAGIAITASHNPPEYNGFKIKNRHGGPASSELIARVEDEINALADEAPSCDSFESQVASGRIELRDITSDYLQMISEKIDVAAIRASGLRIAHDPMYGAGLGMLTRLLGDQVVELHGDLNPGMHGQAPEPIERNLAELASTIVRERCDVGIANDGDADRVGMYDEIGRYVDSHRLLALLVRYLHEERGQTGEVIKTFSTTHMLDRMCEEYGLKLTTVPIGFKYIGPLMLEHDVLVGGEESGGIAVKGHIPERDGIFIGLLIVELMVRTGRPLSDLVQELFDRFGDHAYHRIDVHTSEERKQSILRMLRSGGLTEIAGVTVDHLETLDGYKHITDRGWLLVRASGTEPVLRIYAEAPTSEGAEALVTDAAAQLGLNGH
jgi:phosphomannomutase